MDSTEETETTPSGLTAAVELEERVIAVVRADPERVWLVTDLREAAGLEVIDAVVTLAGLAYDGRIEVLDPGRYQWTGRDPALVREDVRRRIDADGLDGLDELDAAS